MGSVTILFLTTLLMCKEVVFTAGRGGTWVVIRIRGLRASIPNSKIRSLHQMCFCSPTMLPLDLLSTMAVSSRRSSQAIFSLRSTAHGIGAFALVTKSSVYVYTKWGKHQENTRIF